MFRGDREFHDRSRAFYNLFRKFLNDHKIKRMPDTIERIETQGSRRSKGRVHGTGRLRDDNGMVTVTEKKRYLQWLSEK